jgi:brefeldin A-inhibited guanine nucleotide-exchange protein
MSDIDSDPPSKPNHDDQPPSDADGGAVAKDRIQQQAGSDKRGPPEENQWVEINMQEPESDPASTAEDPAEDSVNTLSTKQDSHMQSTEDYEQSEVSSETDKDARDSIVPSIQVDSSYSVDTPQKDLPPLPHESDSSEQQPENGVSTSDARGTRSGSRSTTFSTSTPVGSSVFVITALETIGASREVRKSKEFTDAVQAALANIKGLDQSVDPEMIFRPLQLATRTFSIPLQVTALDCIGKLISYSYFAFPTSQKSNTNESVQSSGQAPLIERAIETICDCFENEATPVEVQQQIVKSLLAAVLNDKIVVHGAGLLKAVRQIYNIFIYSKSSQNQQVAQGSLTQMVSTVFDRVHIRLDLKAARLQEHSGSRSEEELAGDGSILEQAEINGVEGEGEASTGHDSQKEGQEKLTLQSFENNKGLDDTLVTDNGHSRPGEYQATSVSFGAFAQVKHARGPRRWRWILG